MMVLTLKMFEDAMKQINVAFVEVNKKVTKLEKELEAVKEKEKPSASKKTRPKAS